MSKIALSLAALLVSAPLALAQETPDSYAGAGSYDAAVVGVDTIRTSSVGDGSNSTVPADGWDVKSGR